MPDDKPRIWRVTPDGAASIWFTDPRLTGEFGFAGGPLGGRIDSSGKWLYFSITVSGRVPGCEDRLPAAARRCSDGGGPRTGARVPGRRVRRAAPADRARLRESGNLYVSLLGPKQVAVLDPAGHEARRHLSPMFHSPWGLAIHGKSLLVTNGDLEPADNPDAWKIFRVYVGEKGLALNRPRT